MVVSYVLLHLYWLIRVFAYLNFRRIDSRERTGNPRESWVVRLFLLIGAAISTPHQLRRIPDPGGHGPCMYRAHQVRHSLRPVPSRLGRHSGDANAVSKREEHANRNKS